MGAPQRNTDSSLKSKLEKEFYRFSFFKAVNLIEVLHPENKKLGIALVPDQEAVRFSANTTLNFPASEISALTPGEEGDPLGLEVTFLGLTGPTGVLPYWYTELLQERLRRHDTGLKTFLDMFNHRLVSLFYLAWKKHYLPVNYEAGARDRASRYLLSLIGLGTPMLANRIGVPEDSLVYYSGLFARTSPSAAAITETVSHFAAVPVHVEQFIERNLLLSDDEKTYIGGINCQLGINTVVGTQVAESQSKFRVNLGPLNFTQFRRFMPDRNLLRPIFSLVKYMVGIEFEFDIRIMLDKKEMPATSLGGTTCLGWTSWIKNTRFINDKNPSVTFRESDLAEYING